MHRRRLSRSCVRWGWWGAFSAQSQPEYSNELTPRGTAGYFSLGPQPVTRTGFPHQKSALTSVGHCWIAGAAQYAIIEHHEADIPTCYAEPDDRPAFKQFEAIVQRHGGELLPVFLYCSNEEAIRRVSNADRAERRKITSEKGLNKFLAQFKISPVPRADCLVLDSETRSADATAQEIIRHFDLIPLQKS